MMGVFLSKVPSWSKKRLSFKTLIKIMVLNLKSDCQEWYLQVISKQKKSLNKDKHRWIKNDFSLKVLQNRYSKTLQKDSLIIIIKNCQIWCLLGQNKAISVLLKSWWIKMDKSLCWQELQKKFLKQKETKLTNLL